MKFIIKKIKKIQKFFFLCLLSRRGMGVIHAQGTSTRPPGGANSNVILTTQAQRGRL